MLTTQGFAVIGEAANGADAMTMVLEERPDLVLLDIRLPGPDGFEVAHQLARLTPAPAVVLISSHEARVYDQQVLGSPAVAFITKSDLSGDTLRRALGEVTP
ncbi:hypothetical protein GCM10022415_00380 [Knoellia locipacati]